MIHVFIVNTAVCETAYAQKLRKALSEFQNLSYYVFSTRKPGHEKELVELLCRFFDNEELRFYCCGGSGTMRNMLEGIKDLSKAEVTMIPFGTSDFLKAFTDDYSHFRDLRAIIYGEVVYVDYIKSNMGIALNEISFGANTDSLRIGENIKNAGVGLKRMPYLISTIYASFLAPNRLFDISTDGYSTAGEKCTFTVFGNGAVIGGRFHIGLNDVVDDGYATFATVMAKTPFHRIGVLRVSATEDKAYIKDCGYIGLSKRIKARRSNGASFFVDMDGEIFPTVELEAEIVRQGLKFVIPKRGV